MYKNYKNKNKYHACFQKMRLCSLSNLLIIMFLAGYY